MRWGDEALGIPDWQRYCGLASRHSESCTGIIKARTAEN